MARSHLLYEKSAQEIELLEDPEKVPMPVRAEPVQIEKWK